MSTEPTAGTTRRRDGVGRRALTQWIDDRIDLVFLGLIGIVTMLPTGRAQRLGDVAAGTVVELDR